MMSQVIRQETIVFLTSVLHGALLALVYDLLRALRRVFAHSLAAVSAEDFLFWIAAGFFTFCLLFLETDGVIRGYVAVGAALGVILYLNLFSRLVLRIVTGILGGIRSVVKAVGRAAGKVKRTVGKILKKAAGSVKKTVGGLLKRASRKIRKTIGGILGKIVGKFKGNVVFCRSIVHKKIKKRIENTNKKVYNKRSKKSGGGKGGSCKRRRTK